jgi:hypothetical protein
MCIKQSSVAKLINIVAQLMSIYPMNDQRLLIYECRQIKSNASKLMTDDAQLITKHNQLLSKASTKPPN